MGRFEVQCLGFHVNELEMRKKRMVIDLKSSFPCVHFMQTPLTVALAGLRRVECLLPPDLQVFGLAEDPWQQSGFEILLVRWKFFQAQLWRTEFTTVNQ